MARLILIAVVAALPLAACQGSPGAGAGSEVTKQDWFGPQPDRFVRSGPHGDR
jgi:hypothetical protein